MTLPFNSRPILANGCWNTMCLEVYVIGEEGILEELELAGFTGIGGAGCMVAAMCGSTQKEPIVVGKPSTFMMDFLLQKFNIATSRMCMVGDRLDTDILFGKNSGCQTLLGSFRFHTLILVDL
nr:phosphoglycolate phosphatase 2 [Ipomoea trifida]